jgi:hypothetical protein
MAEPLENPLLRTGFSTLDCYTSEARRKAPRSLPGLTLVKDPTDFPKFTRLKIFDDEDDRPVDLYKIQKAYDVDSFARQGVDKYVELCTKHGWYLDCETPEPREYLLNRFQVMGILSDKSFAILVDELVHDFIKYGNAFWVKKRQFVQYPGLPEKGVGGKVMPVAGYFRADPKLMTPYWSKDGSRMLGWQFTPRGNKKTFGKPIVFPRQDVIHFGFNVPAGEVWGSPALVPVLDDIKEYRLCEEYVLKLLYKHLNPILHHVVPDNSGMGIGRQEDLDAANASHQIIAPDGFIVTPPGHDLKYVGAESHSLRGEGYMNLIKARVYAGLGVNQLVMGEGETTTTGSADVMTANMHNRAKLYQRQLGEMLTHHVLFELLMEGGFDPLSKLDLTRWIWNDIETEARLAKENQIIQLFHGNLIDEDEARRGLGHKPFTDEQFEKTYSRRVTIPELHEAAEAKAAASPITGTTSNKARPANQHGKRSSPKIKPSR